MLILEWAHRYYNWLAKRRLLTNRQVEVHPEAVLKASYNIKLDKGGSLRIGRGTIFQGTIYSDHPEANIRIGENCFIGNSVLISSIGIEIGNDVIISWGCNIVDHNSHAIKFSQRWKDVADTKKGTKDWSTVVRKKIIIMDKSWIGFNSIILKGVTIGEGVIIGAGAVITKDVPPWTIVAGNPARIIREIPESER